VFFGPEDEPDARFVELIDCQHLVHAESMDQWVEQAGPEGVVKLAECPICKTPVRSTARYNSAVNSHLLNVEKVKAKLRGEERADTREELKLEMRNLVTTELQILGDNEKPLYDDDKKEKLLDLVKIIQRPENTVSVFQTRNNKEILGFVLALNRLSGNARGLKGKVPAKSSAEAAGIDTFKMGSELQMEIRSFEEKLVSHLKRGDDLLQEKLVSHLKRGVMFSSQQMKEANNEVSRLQHFMELYEFCRIREKKSQHFSSKTAQVLIAMRALLADIWAPFTDAQVAVWKELNADLSKSVTGLGVSDVERKEILAAMGLGQGHWYTCPNGHVYAIGECGGATVESSCPECGERIGGTSHRLLSTNNIATQMDGATRSAYPWGVPE